MRTPPENEKAALAPTSAALNTAHGGDFTIREKLTVLETLGPNLTKIFHSDGTTSSYDNPANFRVVETEIADWPSLIKLLQSLHKNPKRCLIRGKLTGTESNKPGTFVRQNSNFSDQPLHWLMVDVDGFEPAFAAPTDPAAVDEYIEIGRAHV